MLLSADNREPKLNEQPMHVLVLQNPSRHVLRGLTSPLARSKLVGADESIFLSLSLNRAMTGSTIHYHGCKAEVSVLEAPVLALHVRCIFPFVFPSARSIY